jgi:hypothetical protein
MEPKPLKIEELKPEKLPTGPRSATTARAIPEEAQRIIRSAQAAAIRRARRR